MEKSLPGFPSLFGFSKRGTSRLYAQDGAVEKVTWLADTLVPSPGDDLPSPTEIRDAIMLEIAGTMMDTAFPAAEDSSEITLPFLFD